MTTVSITIALSTVYPATDGATIQFTALLARPAESIRFFIFHQQNSLFRQLCYFAQWGLFFANYLTTRVFFTPNSPHQIGPYPSCTIVPPRPPPPSEPPNPPPRPARKPAQPALPAPAQTRPRHIPRVSTMVQRLLRRLHASSALPFLR